MGVGGRSRALGSTTQTFGGELLQDWRRPFLPPLTESNSRWPLQLPRLCPSCFISSSLHVSSFLLCTRYMNRQCSAVSSWFPPYQGSAWLCVNQWLRRVPGRPAVEKPTVTSQSPPPLLPHRPHHPGPPLYCQRSLCPLKPPALTPVVPGLLCSGSFSERMAFSSSVSPASRTGSVLLAARS